MGMILQPYIEQFFASIFVFLILFALIAGLFAREKFIPMLDGFLGVILSFFSCPFIYMRAAVLSMADYRSKSMAGDSFSKQYLLNKLMFFMQAALIVVSIAVFAGNLTTGWVAMVPTKELRDAVRAQESTVLLEKADLQKLESEVKQLDEAWAGQRDQQMEKYTAERTQKIEQLGKNNSELANLINNVDTQAKILFAKIEDFQTKNAEAATKEDLDKTLYILNDYLNKLRVSDGAKGMIKSYNDNWGSLMLAKIERDSLSENELRASIQPTYKKLSGQFEELNRDMQLQEARLSELRAAAAYKIHKFLLCILSGAIMFMLLVWLFGLLIEVLWSAINVSTDVKEIRNSLLKSDNP